LIKGVPEQRGALFRGLCGPLPPRRSARYREHGRRLRELEHSEMQGLVRYFRSNPQAFVLLVICLVLGLGTFIVVLIALATAGSVTTNGEPSGVISALQVLGR